MLLTLTGLSKDAAARGVVRRSAAHSLLTSTHASEESLFTSLYNERRSHLLCRVGIAAHLDNPEDVCILLV